MTMNYTNQYADSANFVDLGEIRVAYLSQQDKQVITHDLYALKGKTEVLFGARYGNEVGDYLSGEASLGKDGKWTLYGESSYALAAAMARYFANYQ